MNVMLRHIYICTRSIQIYFRIFFHFICVSLSFHCSHIISIFSEIFPIFLPILFTPKACHFDMALLILLPFKHPGRHLLWIKASMGPKDHNTQGHTIQDQVELFLIILLPITFHNHFPPRTIFTLHLIRTARAVRHTSVNSHYVLAEVCPPFLFHFIRLVSDFHIIDDITCYNNHIDIWVNINNWVDIIT